MLPQFHLSVSEHRDEDDPARHLFSLDLHYRWQVRTMNSLYRRLRDQLRREQEGALTELSKRSQSIESAELEDEDEDGLLAPDDSSTLGEGVQDEEPTSTIDNQMDDIAALPEPYQTFGFNIGGNLLAALDEDLDDLLEPSIEDLAQLAAERRQRMARKLAKQKVSKRNRAAHKTSKR